MVLDAHTFGKVWRMLIIHSNSLLENPRRDRAKTIFLEDAWIGDRSSANLFPRLYTLKFTKMVCVQYVKAEGFEVIQFIRTLHGETAAQWEELK